MNEAFHLLKFQELIKILVENVFHGVKKNFEPIGHFLNIAEFLTWGKALLIVLSLYFQMLIMEVSTQTDKNM